MKATAVEWLEAAFESEIRIRPDLRPGPACIRPMLELLSVMDTGEPMDTGPADYLDPERRWL